MLLHVLLLETTFEEDTIAFLNNFLQIFRFIANVLAYWQLFFKRWSLILSQTCCHSMYDPYNRYNCSSSCY